MSGIYRAQVIDKGVKWRVDIGREGEEPNEKEVGNLGEREGGTLLLFLQASFALKRNECEGERTTGHNIHSVPSALHESALAKCTCGRCPVLVCCGLCESSQLTIHTITQT